MVNMLTVNYIGIVNTINNKTGGKIIMSKHWIDELDKDAEKYDKEVRRNARKYDYEVAGIYEEEEGDWNIADYDDDEDEYD
jgi:hypothetical protein